MEIVVGIACCYIGVFLLCTIMVCFSTTRSNNHNARISVCVPFRNERDHLDSNCRSLRNLNDTDYEILYSDDHSDDDSSAICEQHGFSVIRVTQGQGKLAALAAAVEKADGEIIVFTDADCVVTRSWLTALRNNLHDDVGLYVGAVAVERMPVMTLDFLCLVGVASALNTLGIPSSCPGANIAVKKSLFMEFYTNTASIHATEDAALLHYIHSTLRQKVRFIFSREHMVTTQPYTSVREFFSQRLRWVKGGIRLNPLLTVYLFFILTAHGLFFAFPSLLWVPVSCAAVFTLCVTVRMRHFSLLPFVPLYAIFFPIYTTLVGILYPFAGRSLQWKGRSL